MTDSYVSTRRRVIPIVSVVMPAFNAERFIAKSIKSILSQSISDFELIICDDCSTDATLEIIKSFDDSRIRLIQTNTNSGSAKYPRELAIEAADASLICWIDSDDTVEFDYLEKMMARMKDTGANIICSRMVAMRDGEEQYTLPARDFDFSSVMSGREAVLLSLEFPWRINFNGWLCEKRMWTSISTFKSLTINHMDADDFSAREILYNAKKVAFADTAYNYRLHPDAITKKIGLKKFESVITDRLVLEYFRKENFRAGAEAMGHSLCLRMISLMRLWCIHHRNMTDGESKQARQLLHRHYKMITDVDINNARLSPKQRLLLKLPFALSLLMINEINND